MSRPQGWQVLDLDRDPTPGEPGGVRVLGRSAERMAQDADRLVRDLRGVVGDGPLLSWLGASGDAVRASLEEFPEQVVKLRDSYDLAAAALTSWADRLAGVQDQADRALEKGREAKADLDGLTAALSAARGAASGSARAADAARSDPGTVVAPGPDPEQVRQAVSAARADAERVASLDRQADAADSRFEAAKRMAQQARELRQAAGRATGRRLRDAAEAGIPPNSLWQDIKTAAGQVWKATVKVATVVAIVVAVVALFVGGPLVWGILLAASLVLLADSLIRYNNGEGSVWEIGLSLLGVVPGGRLLTAMGKVAGLSAVGTRAFAATSRGLAAGRATVVEMSQSVRGGFASRLAFMGDETGSVRLLPARATHRFGALRGNHEYLDNGARYATDVAGRTARVEVDSLVLRPGVRDAVEQRRVGRLGEPGDQGGHLIGTRFGGSFEGYNLIPQNARVNLSDWKKIENEWHRALAQGRAVEDLRITPMYAGDALRPYEVRMTYLLDGKPYARRVPNQAVRP